MVIYLSRNIRTHFHFLSFLDTEIAQVIGNLSNWSQGLNHTANTKAADDLAMQVTRACFLPHTIHVKQVTWQATWPRLRTQVTSLVEFSVSHFQSDFTSQLDSSHLAYRQVSNISTKNPNYQNILALSCGCLCRIPWSQMLSREWRCSWSSADRRCSNYISVIDNFIAY